MKIYQMSPTDLEWLCERTGLSWSPSLRGLMAVDAMGRTHGAVGFDGWIGNAAQMHMAFDNPAAVRALIGPSFSYLFEECGKEIALGAIPAHNYRSIRLAKHVGFKETHRVIDGWAPKDDMVLLELRKADCRWLSKERKAA